MRNVFLAIVLIAAVGAGALGLVYLNSGGNGGPGLGPGMGPGLDLTNFKPERAVNPFPPITDFPVKPVSEVQDELGPKDLVLGVTINGQSRAYSINMLTGPQREILNDKLGGQAIAATW